MAIECGLIIEKMEELAPLYLAESWDNPGLLVGDVKKPIKKVLVALDATEEVIAEAVTKKADMLITHHPMLFHPIKQITRQTPLGRKLYKLIQNDICLYAAHTNLDVCFGGTNDVLATLIGLENVELLKETIYADGKQWGIGRIGVLKEAVPLMAFAKELKEKLSLDMIRAVGDGARKIQKVALCTGSGMEFLDDAVRLGADLYITADIKFHDSQKALELGICLLDATHYQSEVLIVPEIVSYLSACMEEYKEEIEFMASNVCGYTFLELL